MTVVDPGAPTCPSESQVSVAIDSTIVMDAQVDNFNSCVGQTDNITSNVIGTAAPVVLTCGLNNNNGTGCIYGDYISPIGNGANNNNAAATPFGGANVSKKTQYLWTVTDLNNAGITSGSISGMSFNIATKNTKKNAFANFTIKMGCTNNNVLTANNYLATATVFGPQTFDTKGGWNNITFANQFDWDGTSNIVVEVCFDNGNKVKANDFVLSDNAGAGSIAGIAGSGVCGSTSSSTGANRPYVRFRVCNPPPAALVYSWSPSTGLDNAAIADPTFTGDGNDYNFVVTVTGGLCPLTDSVQVSCLVPLKLLKFTAGKTLGKVNLDWETTKIVDLNFFDVQRSKDGEKFVNIGRVQGNDVYKYNLVDENPIKGINYYRLKAVKNLEGFDYSEILKVNFNQPTIANVYPNPFTSGNSFFVELVTKGDFIEVQLIDLLGREVENQFFDSEEGDNVVEYNTSELSPGTYIYKIKTLEGENIGKVIMNK